MLDWDEIVKENGQTIWRIANRLLNNQSDATDCLQETFLSALVFSRNKTVQNWKALLIRMATARALDRMRQRFREKNYAGQNIESLEVSSRDPSPLEQSQAAELGGQLRLALAQLPEQQAEVFCLRYLDDLTYDEIAAELGLQPNHVGVLLHRARAQLRSLLGSAHQLGRDGVHL